MKLPYRIDLGGKVAVVTGAGGVLMSEFAKALAACGAKVALLDINEEAAKAVAGKRSIFRSRRKKSRGSRRSRKHKVE